MNLYDKIDKLYKENTKIENIKNTDHSLEILKELKEIKELLKSNNKITTNIDNSMRNFVANFRDKLKPNTQKNIYPEVEYFGRVLGVNYRGLLYDKSTSSLITTAEAFEVYKYFYNKHLQEINH